MGTSFLHKQSQSQVKKKLNMKTLLVIALFAVAHAEEEAAADPVAPVVYTHPFYHHMAAPVYAHHPAVYHHAPVYTYHVAPVVYAAANVCKNEGGQLVPRAHGVAPGSAIYAMADAPAMVPTVAAAPAAEAAEDVVSVEKRDAEADAEADPAAWYYGYYGHPYGHHYGYAGYYGYYGHPYYGYGGVGCRNNLGALVPCAGK